MIESRSDLREYLEADKRQLRITRNYPRPFADEIWKYEICLRKYEFWINQKSLFAVIPRLWHKFWFHRISVQLGIFIGPNTCGKGLCITHINGIQINWQARCGENLRIQENVTIGGTARGGVPTIGNNVYLGSGCKIIGSVKIPDGCVVGANAVVVKSIEEEGITVGGIPAKKISDNNSDLFIYY